MSSFSSYLLFPSHSWQYSTCWLAPSFYTGDSTCGLSTIRTESKIPSASEHSTDGGAKLYSVGNEVQFSSKRSLRFCTDEDYEAILNSQFKESMSTLWEIKLKKYDRWAWSVVLQCVAVRCSVLQYSVLYLLSRYYVTKQKNDIANIVHCIATQCNTLQHAATHCFTLQHTLHQTRNIHLRHLNFHRRINPFLKSFSRCFIDQRFRSD